MERNEIIDTVLERLTKQGRPAKKNSNNGCAYYIEQDKGCPPLKCGVGVLLEDSVALDWETKGRINGDTDLDSMLDAIELANEVRYELDVDYYIPDYFFEHRDLLSKIQDIHDDDYVGSHRTWMDNVTRELTALRTNV